VTYTYDNASRREALVDPDGGRTTYSYDNASRLTTLLNPFSERTTWAYDGAGRATTITLANALRYAAEGAATQDEVAHDDGVR